MDILGGRPFSLRPPSRHKKLQDSYLLTWKDVFEKENVMLMHELQNYIYHNEGMVSKTKLLSDEVKKSQVILRIVLPILTKFLQKSQIRRVLLQEVTKQSPE